MSTAEEREADVRGAMEMTLEELVIWAVGRRGKPDEDTYRQGIVKLELARRVAVAQLATAQSTQSSARGVTWSVVFIALAAIIQCLTWLYPHVAK